MSLFGGSESESASQQQTSTVNATPAINFSGGGGLSDFLPLALLIGSFFLGRRFFKKGAK